GGAGGRAAGGGGPGGVGGWGAAGDVAAGGCGGEGDGDPGDGVAVWVGDTCRGWGCDGGADGGRLAVARLDRDRVRGRVDDADGERACRADRVGAVGRCD